MISLVLLEADQLAVGYDYDNDIAWFVDDIIAVRIVLADKEIYESCWIMKCMCTQTTTVGK